MHTVTTKLIDSFRSHSLSPLLFDVCKHTTIRFVLSCTWGVLLIFFWQRIGQLALNGRKIYRSSKDHFTKKETKWNSYLWNILSLRRSTIEALYVSGCTASFLNVKNHCYPNQIASCEGYVCVSFSGTDLLHTLTPDNWHFLGLNVISSHFSLFSAFLSEYQQGTFPFWVHSGASLQGEI